MTNTGPLTDEELAAIKARYEAATPGPWQPYIEGRDHVSGSCFIRTGEGAARGDDMELTGATEADYDFIAHARQDMPRLLEEVEGLRKFVKPHR